MKIILLAVNSKYIHSNLAVWSLHAYAGKLGIETEVLEFTINQPATEILQGIYEKKPDLLAVSAYIWNIVLTEELIEDLHLVLPELQIWLGGPEASWRAEELLKAHPSLSGVMRGEGEHSFAQICGYYLYYKKNMLSAKALKPCRLSDIRGLTWRDETGIHSTPDALPLNLDNLPFPYAGQELPEHKIFYYESSRGCPFGCTYCLSSVEKGVRFRDLRLVKRELQFFLDRQAAQVKFVDRTFNCHRKRSMEIWQYIREHDNGVTNFHFEVSADLLEPEEISLLAALRPGQVQLECGVQSLNADTLAAVHRKMDFKRLSENVRLLRKNHNIHLHLDLIAGLPFEDFESFCASFDGVYAMRPDQLQLGFLKVLPGSPMAESAEDYDCSFHQKPPYEVVRTRWLSYDDIIRLKKAEEMLEVYYNSGQFKNTVEQLAVLFPGFSLYDALAAFYESAGYFGIAHSRIRRYEILLEFLRAQGCRTEDYLESILTDIYLRENLKNRPAFAPSADAYRGRIREFYQEEARTHAYLAGYEGYDWKQLRSMTHLEVFDGKAVLFDYKERDPVDHSARMIQIPDFQNGFQGRFFNCEAPDPTGKSSFFR